jgi:cytochrome c556
MNRAAVLCVILLLADGAAGIAAAHVAADPIVSQRQASMKAMANAVKTISGMFDGKQACDAADLKEAAETIRRRSGNDAMRMRSGSAMGGSLLGKRSDASADVDPSRIPAEHAST